MAWKRLLPRVLHRQRPLRTRRFSKTAVVTRSRPLLFDRKLRFADSSASSRAATRHFSTKEQRSAAKVSFAANRLLNAFPAGVAAEKSGKTPKTPSNATQRGEDAALDGVLMDPIRAAEVFPELLRFSDRFLAVQEDRDSDRKSMLRSMPVRAEPEAVAFLSLLMASDNATPSAVLSAAKSLNESKILILTSDFAGTLEGDRGDTIARWLIRRFIASGDVDAVIDSVCLRGRESRYLVEQAKSAAAGRWGDIASSLEVLCERGMPLSSFARECLIRMASKFGDLDDAIGLFQSFITGKMEPDTRVCNAAMTAMVDDGNFPQAIQLYKDMIRWSLRPDAETFQLLLRAAASSGMRKDVAALCVQIDETGVIADDDLVRAMVDARVRFGEIADALDALRHIPGPPAFAKARARAHIITLSKRKMDPTQAVLVAEAWKGRVGEGLPPSVFLSLFENQSPQDVEFATKYIPTQSGGELVDGRILSALDAFQLTLSSLSQRLDLFRVVLSAHSDWPSSLDAIIHSLMQEVVNNGEEDTVDYDEDALDIVDIFISKGWTPSPRLLYCASIFAARTGRAGQAIVTGELAMEHVDDACCGRYIRAILGAMNDTALSDTEKITRLRAIFSDRKVPLQAPDHERFLYAAIRDKNTASVLRILKAMKAEDITPAPGLFLTSLGSMIEHGHRGDATVTKDAIAYLESFPKDKQHLPHTGTGRKSQTKDSSFVLPIMCLQIASGDLTAFANNYMAYYGRSSRFTDKSTSFLSLVFARKSEASHADTALSSPPPGQKRNVRFACLMWRALSNLFTIDSDSDRVYKKALWASRPSSLDAILKHLSTLTLGGNRRRELRGEDMRFWKPVATFISRINEMDKGSGHTLLTHCVDAGLMPVDSLHGPFVDTVADALAWAPRPGARGLREMLGHQNADTSGLQGVVSSLSSTSTRTPKLNLFLRGQGAQEDPGTASDVSSADLPRNKGKLEGRWRWKIGTGDGAKANARTTTVSPAAVAALLGGNKNQKIWQRKRREQKFPVSGILGGAGNRANPKYQDHLHLKAAAVGSLLGKFNQRDPAKRSDHSIEETSK